MKEIFDTEILDKSMWNMYQTMKDDNFQFDGYSHEDKVMMVNHILPYFEKIGEYEVCKELHDQITPNNKRNKLFKLITMKDKIIERLLTDSRITIPLADSLLNNRPNKANIIELLLEDGDIDSAEAMTLLRDSDDSLFPFRTPNHMITLPHIDFPGTGNPGMPIVPAKITTQPSTSIKEGVEDLFESNPELATIGTPEQYSQYLDTIFPDSKVKDIVYHGSDKKFDNFLKEFARKDRPYFYFSFIEEANMYKEAREGSYVYPVILNVKNYASGYTPDELDVDVVNNLIKKGYDAVAGRGWTTREEIAVFELEQIHRLGSKQDIKGFKEFVSQPTKQTSDLNAPDGLPGIPRTSTDCQ
jgi:hypothetical protein